MAGAQRGQRGIITGINVTPLVDITLVLLVVFIVTAKIVVHPAMPVDLPKASSGTDVQIVLSITLTAEGATLVNGGAVASDAEVANRARKTLIEHPELRAVIQADGAVRHERVMAVMDTLRRAGVSRIAFATELGEAR